VSAAYFFTGVGKQCFDQMQVFLVIKAFPDVQPALAVFKQAGIKLAFLSNMTESMLSAGIKNSGLGGYFDHILSSDQAKIFKPYPKAYNLAPESFGLDKEEIAFAAFASWDASGAKWFGFPTLWVNRLHFGEEVLKVQPDAIGTDMGVLRRFVL
jgi:2-haloacid dehalogenase